MPKAVIKDVDQDDQGIVTVTYDVFRDDGTLWREILITLPVDEYSEPEIERRIRIVLAKCKQIEACRSDPKTPTKGHMKAALVNREIVA